MITRKMTMFKHFKARKSVLIAAGVCLLFASAPVGAVVTENLKLVPNDPQPGSNFGFAVGTGQGVAVVGAYSAGVGGAAYLFDTTTGQQLFKLEPDNPIAGTAFGRSIAVDGNLAVIGAPNLSATASAYVFDLTTGNQVAKIDVPSGLSSVAIHGNTVLVGSPGLNAGFGGALLFDVTSGNLLQTFIDESPVANDALGNSVAFQGGLVAAFNLNNGSPTIVEKSTVLLFDPLTGDQLAEFIAPEQGLASSDLAISGDKLLVGAAGILSSSDSGVYDISTPGNISGTILPWPEISGGLFFGISVALNEDAALVSTYLSSDISGSGIVYMFDPDTGVLLDSFRPLDAVVDDLFGYSSDLFGNTLLVGAPGSPISSGAAYLFTIPEPTTLAVFLVAGSALLGGRRQKRRRSAIAH
jgi:outer membrane protein assembly factor BamB